MAAEWRFWRLAFCLFKFVLLSRSRALLSFLIVTSSSSVGSPNFFTRHQVFFSSNHVRFHDVISYEILSFSSCSDARRAEIIARFVDKLRHRCQTGEEPIRCSGGQDGNCSQPDPRTGKLEKHNQLQTN